MVRLVLLFSLVLAPVGLVGAQDETNALPKAEGLESIFNGEDLNGWDGDPRLWSVKNGVIHGETTPEIKASGNTFLIWKDGKLGDFELRLSFRCNATNNSGIQYRSKHITEGERIGNKWVVQGYQHEIRNENTLPNVSGFIYDEGGSRGRIILVGQKGAWKDGKLNLSDEILVSPAEYSELFKLDDWNDVVIIAKGNHIRHYTNGRLVLDFRDSDEKLLRQGVLALQLHAGKPMWVEFRDIRLKQLD